VVTGESGIFLSPNYMDQWSSWFRGSTFTLPYSRQAIEKHTRHVLVLVPAS